MTNPFDSLVAQITGEIETLRKGIADQQQLYDGYIASAAAWRKKYNEARPNRRDPKDLEWEAENLRLAALAQGRRSALEGTLTSKKSDLEAAKKKRDAVDKAAADSMAKGTDPASAYAGAAGEAERAELVNNILKWLAIGLGVVAFIYGVGMLQRWRKNKK